jgi:hypothetical protein
VVEEYVMSRGREQWQYTACVCFSHIQFVLELLDHSNSTVEVHRLQLDDTIHKLLLLDILNSFPTKAPWTCSASALNVLPPECLKAVSYHSA